MAKSRKYIFHSKYSVMNFLNDVLKLEESGSISLGRTGLAMTDAQQHFNSRMQALIGVCYTLLCLTKDEANKMTNDALPSMDEMRKELAMVNQDTPLPQLAQCYYYCAVSVLLTMDGHDDQSVLLQSARADMLINSGVLN